MSLDKLAVIFIIIILPISVVLSAYTNAQIKTLELQLSYDTKLNNATADAIKAYQLNAFNESTSNLTTSKMRDINAAAKTFFNSLSTNFNMEGYGKSNLEEFVPALVFTMYDGYYIYSKYTNTLTDKDYTTGDPSRNIQPSTYQNGDLLYGTHPLVSYSCRYKDYPKSGDDFVISYTLDNYITIQGFITFNSQRQWVNDSGYLIDKNQIEYNPSESYIKYRGKKIEPETIRKERVGGIDSSGKKIEYKYQKINGVKYYYDENRTVNGKKEPKWFSIINGDKVYTNTYYNAKYDYSAYNYYKDAHDFTKRIESYGLKDLTPQNAYGSKEVVKPDGSIEIKYEKISNELKQSVKTGKIFGENFSQGIEEPSSYFNEHRLAVIRYTIEKNLSVAIKNYNKIKYVNSSNPPEADFQMPEFNETEWDKILNNITLISYLQGLPIGGKIYSGCSVVANNKNDEVVTEESIYLANTTNKNYYNAKYYSFKNSDKLDGIFNVDLERRMMESGDASVEPDYFYPQEYLADYDSVVSPTKNVNLYSEKTDTSKYMYNYNGNIYKYMQNNAPGNVATAYFTALGRERYSTYKVSRPYKIPSEAMTFENNSHKYWVFDARQMEVFNKQPITWHNAEAYCESLGGHLVTGNTARECTFLQNNMYNHIVAAEYWVGEIRNSSRKN